MAEILAIFNTQFDPHTLTVADCRSVVRNPTDLGLTGNMLNEDELRAVLDGVVPIAVMRTLIRQVPLAKYYRSHLLEPHQAFRKEFDDTFASLYGNTIGEAFHLDP